MVSHSRALVMNFLIGLPLKRYPSRPPVMKSLRRVRPCNGLGPAINNNKQVNLLRDDLMDSWRVYARTTCLTWCGKGSLDTTKFGQSVKTLKNFIYWSLSAPSQLVKQFEGWVGMLVRYWIIHCFETTFFVPTDDIVCAQDAHLITSSRKGQPIRQSRLLHVRARTLEESGTTWGKNFPFPVMSECDRLWY